VCAIGHKALGRSCLHTVTYNLMLVGCQISVFLHGVVMCLLFCDVLRRCQLVRQLVTNCHCLKTFQKSVYLCYWLIMNHGYKIPYDRL